MLFQFNTITTSPVTTLPDKEFEWMHYSYIKENNITHRIYIYMLWIWVNNCLDKLGNKCFWKQAL